jgi:hypothetical protein
MCRLVDKQGRFVDEVTDFAGRYVKEEYYTMPNVPQKVLNRLMY